MVFVYVHKGPALLYTFALGYWPVWSNHADQGGSTWFVLRVHHRHSHFHAFTHGPIFLALRTPRGAPNRQRFAHNECTFPADDGTAGSGLTAFDRNPPLGANLGKVPRSKHNQKPCRVGDHARSVFGNLGIGMVDNFIQPPFGRRDGCL